MCSTAEVHTHHSMGAMALMKTDTIISAQNLLVRIIFMNLNLSLLQWIVFSLMFCGT